MLVVLLALSGCDLSSRVEQAKEAAREKIAEEVVEAVAEHADGVKSVDIRDGHITVVGDDGQVIQLDGTDGSGRIQVQGVDGAVDVTLGAQATVPAGFPLSVYPGGTVALGGSGVADGRTQVVVYTTPAAADAVAGYYEASMGPPTSREAAGNGTLMSWAVAESAHTVMVSTEGGKTTVILSTSSK